MENLAEKIEQERPAIRRNLLGSYSYDVDLGFFSGPMDLLLHLVHQQEVPVAEVEMRLICEQYLRIVLKTAERDLERATEYLVIAATLLSIKSAALLPVESLSEAEVNDPGYDVRFFENLRTRLLAYEECKQRADVLRALPQYGYDTFSRNDRRMLIPSAQMIAEEEENVNTLSLAFVSLLKRIGVGAKFFKVQLESVSVVHYMMRMVERFKSVQEFSFYKLLGGFSSIAWSKQSSASKKSQIIGNFIAVLELAKRGVIKVSQGADQADFELAYRLKEDEEVGELESEFDMLSSSERSLEDSQKVVHLSKLQAERSERKSE